MNEFVFNSPLAKGLFNSDMLETAISLDPGFFEYADFLAVDAMVWILGKTYNALHDKDALKKDISSRCWLTYRKGFPALDWQWDAQTSSDNSYKAILEMFQDKRSALFSIHQIAQMGASIGKPIGEWLGPNTVAHVLKKLVIYDKWSSLSVHVAMDNTVIIENVRREAFSPVPNQCLPVSNDQSEQQLFAAPCHSKVENSYSPSKWRPLVLLVPLRLGLTEFDAVYSSAIKEFFMLKQCLGIIGGRPNHALYFIGCIGDELIYLDPHYCQSVVDLTSEGWDDSSYHCSFILRMAISGMDPSLALGFFCKTEAEFDDLCVCFRKSLLKASQPSLFELMDKQPSYLPLFEPYSGAGADSSGSQSTDEWEMLA